MSENPCTTCTPGLLELTRPLDVAPLVESSLELDETDSLLPLFGTVDQGGHERAVVRRAVDRGLHRDHVLVRRRGTGECLEARTERLVRLMDEHVSPADLVEEVRCVLHAREPRLRQRRPRLVLEIGPVDLHELHQVCEVEEPLDAIHLVVGGAEPVAETIEHRLGGRGGHLDADHVTEPAAPKLRLDRLEKIVGIV